MKTVTLDVRSLVDRPPCLSILLAPPDAQPLAWMPLSGATVYAGYRYQNFEWLFWKSSGCIWTILERRQHAGQDFQAQVFLVSQSEARRWMTRILLFNPSTKPSGTLFSGLQ
ncbi:MAG: hypothetical protein M3436_19640 [Pseudomonadota bacterium]|nr:hypothetical protein [Pseudomonadota bacterium]